MKCCICGKEFDGWGSNPWPLRKESWEKDSDRRSCSECTTKYVDWFRNTNVWKSCLLDNETLDDFTERASEWSFTELKEKYNESLKLRKNDLIYIDGSEENL